MDISAFLSVIDAYSAATGVSDGGLSRRIFNAGHRIRQIREGSDIGVKRMSEALQWLSDNWPEKAVWPADVVRTCVSSSVVSPAAAPEVQSDAA